MMGWQGHQKVMILKKRKCIEGHLVLQGLVTCYNTKVPRSYETAPPQDPAVALCLGTYGGPRGVGVSYERGTPPSRGSGRTLTFPLPSEEGAT